jgi:hypothetical protein
MVQRITKGELTMPYLLALAFASLMASSAFAAEQSKATQSAIFRVRVAECKTMAKDAQVKANSTEFYTFMAGCIDKVTVTIASK